MNPGSAELADGDGILTAGELSRVAAKVLGELPFPAVVLDVPSGCIVVSSPAAEQLLDPDGRMVVGRPLEEFTADQPASGVDLLAGGRLNGYETFRVLRRRHGPGARVRMWVRSFADQPPSRLVLVVLVADDVAGAPAERDWQEAPAIVGTADANLRIDRISNDAEELFGRGVPELLGEPLLSLIAEADEPSLLSSLTDASTSHSGISLYLDVTTAVSDSPMHCEVLLLPLEPAPSCAFFFLPSPARMAGKASVELSTILRRLGRTAIIAGLARGVFRGMSESTTPGLNQLTTRELEIVARLLDGDRPPEIAKKLFLSQSTVRNHLASVFAKVGVTSQQELLNLLRDSQAGLGSD